MLLYQTILTTLYLFLPVLIIFITGKSKLASRIGSVIIAYALGLILGNTGIFPTGSTAIHDLLASNPNLEAGEINELILKGTLQPEDLGYFRLYKLQDLFLTLSIPLAIPLLLFSLKVKIWLRVAGSAFISMLLAIGSVIFVVFTAMLIFSERIDNMDEISGMLVGLYTGGTPNLASLKVMLNVDADTYLKIHTYDMVPSLFFLFFLISVGKYLFRRFLPSYPSLSNREVYSGINYDEESYSGFFKKHNRRQLGVALLAALVIFGISGSLSFLFREQQMLVVILGITTLGLLASWIPYINRIEKSFELGMYFILVFSIVVASMANIQQLINISVNLFLAITYTIFATLLLHTLLAKIFKVDADTLMVTSTALICSPPFVPMVAGALKNREVVVSGLTVGIIGYAAGNYLGFLVKIIFESFLF